jgi:hypothetical protein
MASSALFAGTASAAPPSSAAEIAAGAVACVEALGNGRPNQAAIEAAGWRSEGSRASGFAREGSNVRIMFVPMGAGMCVVDAYGEGDDSFGSISEAIRSQLTARFGRQVSLGRALGDESSASRGQGFIVGNRVSVLSSERRPDGLSIRVTAMSMPR